MLYEGEDVRRALSPTGLADWRALAATEFFARASEAGSVVATRELDVPEALPEGAAGLLGHERIPFVSYPYEWPFGMLRDAAALQLEVLLEALDEGLTLKDASPYNVQWRGARPVFVDVGSFERLRAGEPWAGYRQFCMLYLYPLLLQAYRQVPFHPWLRGSLDGITPEQCRNLLSRGDLLRPGVLSHVALHARLDASNGGSRSDVRAELREAGFAKGLIEANARRLLKLVRGLDWSPSRSTWTEYGDCNSYSEADAAQKAEFVRAASESGRWRLTWDLGANDGRYSRIAAARSRYLVAIDGDHGAVEQLYRALRDEQSDSILALTLDLTDPSPNLGWRGRERKGLAERGRPDLVLCLALVHHVAIAANVPLAQWIDWLRSLAAHLVIELPTREDAMVERLLEAKAGSHPDYDRERFEALLAEAFVIERTQTLGSGTRVLYFARPRE